MTLKRPRRAIGLVRQRVLLLGATAALWATVLVTVARAQEQRYDLLYDLPGRDGRGAATMAGGSDLNGDSYSDYLVHYAGIKVGSFYRLPTLVIFSGLDGHPLWHHDEDLPDTYPLAWTSDLGDVDGDGREDIVVGNPSVPSPSGNGLGRVEVLQCDSGSKIWERYADDGASLGYQVKAAGDLNGDGRSEVLCQYYVYPNEGVTVLSGLDGSDLYHYGGGNMDLDQALFVGTGDVDLDGFPDFAIAAFDQPPAGTVWIYSGATGQMLWQIEPIMAGEHFGPYVTGPGDLDGDGNADVVFPGRHAVYAYSGPKGTALWAAPYVDGAQGLGPVSQTSDDDGDGVPEILATHRNRDYTLKDGVAVFSGRTGRFLTLVFDTRPKRDYFGSEVHGTGDVNGDGLGDWIVRETDYTEGEYRGFGRPVIVARNSLRAVEGTPMRDDPYLQLAVPSQPYATFALLFALSAESGVPLGTRTIPLDGDALFRQFIEHPLFGKLDANGEASIQFARHGWPPLDVSCCAIVLDGAAPLGVRTISNSASLPVR
ncbi:MAG: FG-GAP-like repeat-containing protein [Planctomycetota bacterium]